LPKELLEEISMADFDSLRKMAIKLLNVSEKLSYGPPAFYLKRTLFARLFEDEDMVVMKM
jgi:hypothetical protein